MNKFHIPTGPYCVGVTDLHLIDHARIETNDPSAPSRELMLHVWYPANHHKAQAETPYDADACASTQRWVSAQSGVPCWFLRGLCRLKIVLFRVPTYALPHAPWAAVHQPFPVIVISHGTDTMVQHYTWIGEELASQGYVVVGINHPYMAAVTRFPDGRVICGVFPEKLRADKTNARGPGRRSLGAGGWKQAEEAVALEDIAFVIDWLGKRNGTMGSFFVGKLNMERLGMIGHSRGGRLAVEICQKDSRIKAIVNLDGVSKGAIALKIPALFVIAEKNYRWHTEKGKAKRAEIAAMQTGATPFEIYSIPFAGHAVFTDLSFLLHSSLLTRFLSRFLSIELESSSAQGIEAIQATAQKVVQFFGKYLR